MQSSDAADVMQDVFQSVAAKINQFGGKDRDGSFRGWLWVIARNKIRDFYRREAKQVRGRGGTDAMLQIGEVPDVEPESLSASDSADESHSPQHRALGLIRDEFESRTWQAFEQVVMGSRSVADVASDLGISANAVRIAKCRVLKRLRGEFGDLL